MMSDYKVELINDGMQEFYVHFNGPNESKSSLRSSFFVFFLLHFYFQLCYLFYRIIKVIALWVLCIYLY
jgi:hypothetical protein